MGPFKGQYEAKSRSSQALRVREANSRLQRGNYRLLLDNFYMNMITTNDNPSKMGIKENKKE